MAELSRNVMTGIFNSPLLLRIAEMVIDLTVLLLLNNEDQKNGPIRWAQTGISLPLEVLIPLLHSLDDPRKEEV